MNADAELLQVVDALRAPGGFPRRLDRRQQQSNQDADDGNHDQQLNQRETAFANSNECHTDSPEVSERRAAKKLREPLMA
jgi:hypothetical protein